jgi:ABC-2 type transport system permease protein
VSAGSPGGRLRAAPRWRSTGRAGGPPSGGPPRRRRSAAGLAIAALAVARKDITSALAERAFTFTTIIIPINYLILFTIIAASGARAPIAVVMRDHGPAAQALVSSMRNARSFKLHVVGAKQAAQMFDAGTAVGIVTVPASLDADLRVGRRVALPVTLNNLNVDFTNDIRRALPLSINAYIEAHYPRQLPVRTREVDLHRTEAGFLQYVAVSSLVIAVALGGMLQAGTLAAREFETGTLKMLLLAPADRLAVQCGRILAGMVLGLPPILLLLAITVGVIGITPANIGELLLDTVVVLFLFVAIGNLVGNLVRRRPAVIPLCAGIGTPLFAAGGAFIPVTWEHPVISVIAHAMPTYYALAVFHHAFYAVSSTPQGTLVNLGALLAMAVITIAFSTRRIVRYEVTQ